MATARRQEDDEGPAGRSRRTRRVSVPSWALGAALVALAVLALALWSVTAPRHSHVHPSRLDSFTDLLPSIAGLTQGPILDGNRVRVLQDQAFFDAVVADVAAARHSVHFETYVWWQGAICRRLAATLAAKAREGVTVRLLVDAVGGSRMSDATRREMTDAGVKLVWYHPFDLVHLGTFNHRDHRKLAIIDGRIGYAFGHGIADEWSPSGGEEPQVWRDTAVRVEGPLVGELQSVFLGNWMEETSEVPAGEGIFPDLEPVGGVRAHVVASSHPGEVSTVELLYKLAIASARKTILIQNPYFVPGEDVIDLLREAVRRGVRVRIMLPGSDAVDSKLVLHAGHVHYRALLEAGVELYEYTPTLLHAKVMVVDGLWSHVGSTNFDARSFEINDEVSVGMIDPEVAAQLTAAFERDLAHCRRLRAATWHRSLWHELLDRAAHLTHEEI